MKNTFKKSLLLLMVFLFAFSTCVGFAKKTKQEKKSKQELYEKYNYDENFKYDDVTIAHALKSSVVLIFADYTANVEYTQAEFDVEGTKQDIEELYAKSSGEYTEEEFADIIVEDMIYNISNYLEWGDTKYVPVELSWRGSGVVIGENGYVATNSHVATLTEESKHYTCMDYLYAGIMEDLNEVVDELLAYNIPVSDDQMYSVYDAALQEILTTAEITDEEDYLYVCFPSASGETALGDDRTYEAQVLANGVSVDVSGDGTTQDAAILEIDKDNLIALKLSDSYPEVNSKIVSAGFPVDADAIFHQGIGSGESILSVTVGSGNIARLIPIDGHDYKALEITTTISGGNSGGPSVDTKLNIEGLNTYGTHDSLYAYMVPAEYVKELAEEFDIGQDKVTLTFLTGLQMLQQDYGAAAYECFEAVKDLNGDVPYIEHLMNLAEKAPQEYPEITETEEKASDGDINSAKDKENNKKLNDKTDTEPASKGKDYTMIAIIGGIALAIIIAVVTTVLVIKSKKKKALTGAPVRYDIPVSGADTSSVAGSDLHATFPNTSAQSKFGQVPGGFGSVSTSANITHQKDAVNNVNIQNNSIQRNANMSQKSDPVPDSATHDNRFNLSHDKIPMADPALPNETKSNPASGKFVGKFNFGGTTPGFINTKKEDDK